MRKTGLDLTKGSLLKNLVVLSLPIMLSNFMQTVYNLTDMFWLGRLTVGATEAVSVAGMAFPLIFFINSLGFGFAVAGTSLTAQYKGAGREDMIRKLMGQLFWIVIIFSIIFVTIAVFLTDDILLLLQTPDEIYSKAETYITIILSGLSFMFLFMCYQAISHGLGDTISPMNIQVISIIINLILDPILIFGWFGFPELGVLGAAVATFSARFITVILAIYYIFKRMKNYIPSKEEFRPDLTLIKKILAVGLPSSISHSMTSFGFVILQGFVNTFGTTVMAVHSIGNRIIGFFMMPAMGMSNALGTIIGQNLGAGKVDRAEKSVGIAFKLIMSVMTLGCLFIFFYAAGLTKFFVDDPDVIAIGKRMFKITAVSANIFGILFVFMGVFNGSGHTKESMKFTITRLWLFRLPFVFIMSGVLLKYDIINTTFLKYPFEVFAKPLSEHPYEALWWSMAFSNTLAAIWAYILYRKGKWKKKII